MTLTAREKTRNDMKNTKTDKPLKGTTMNQVISKTGEVRRIPIPPRESGESRLYPIIGIDLKEES